MPFAAVAFASCANTAAMRNAELSSGISVYDAKTGEVYGTSKVAAQHAIGLTCLSRVVISAGCLIAPPAITAVLTKSKKWNLDPILTNQNAGIPGRLSMVDFDWSTSAT